MFAPQPDRNASRLLAALLAVGVLCSIRPLWDIDLFWHVEAGDLIRARGALPTTDTFSAIRPERPWVPFQWGYEVLVSGANDLGGLELLRWLHIGLLGLAFGFAAWLARRRLGRAGALGLALLLVAYLDRIRARPHVFNLLGMLAVLAWLVARAEPRRRWPWARELLLVLLGTIWANLHAGGSVALLAVAGAYGAGQVLARAPAAGSTLRATALAGLGMALAPGFIPGVVQAAAMYGETRALIPEWQPSWVYLLRPTHPIHPVMGAIPWAMAGATLLAIRKMRRDDLPELLASLTLLGLSLTSARFLYLAALVPLLWPRVLGRLRSATAGGRLALGAAAVLGLLFLHENLWVQQPGPLAFAARMGTTLEPRRFPVEAADLLREASLEGEALHLSDWGGYLLYRTFPKIRVYGDGRGNFGPDVARHLRLSHRRQGRHAYLRATLGAFPADLLVFPPPLFDLDVHDPRIFLLVWADPVAEVYLVRGPRFSANLERVTAALRRRGMDLPDPTASPRAFEIAVRHGRARLALARPEARRGRARLEAAARAQPAKGLELSAWLAEEGDLRGARAALQPLLRSAPATRPLGAVARIRAAALEVRLGAPPARVRATLGSATGRGLLPRDGHTLDLLHKLMGARP